MSSLHLRAALLVLASWVVAIPVSDAQQPATPAEQYKALLKEYQDASAVLQKTASDEERKKAVERVAKLPLRFLELAEKTPKDPIALDALIQAVWVANDSPYPAGGKDSPGGRALALLLRDHVRSNKLGPVCERISVGFRKEYETFLRTVLETNPHREVQALACLDLARFVNNRLQRLDLVKDQPDLARKYEDLFGKDYLDELRRQDRARAAKEVEALYEQAAGKYGDVKISLGKPGWYFVVGQKAKTELTAIRLAIGKESPEIEGQDQDGKPFKLSDYRGKVVLLDFWHSL